ncbi:MAG: hypothetical protein QNJ73_07245 [Gammaproteobacteria bacterium]|nr:hypothetical protein [Gammaproteobacteria bacterium]
MMSIASLVTALILVAVAQLNFKLFVMNRSIISLVLMLACFALAQLGFFVALLELQVGVVYMSTALTHGLVMLFAKYVLQEQVTRHHVGSLAVIVTGLVIYAA